MSIAISSIISSIFHFVSIYIYIHIDIYIYIHTYTYVSIYTHSIYIYIYTHVYLEWEWFRYITHSTIFLSLPGIEDRDYEWIIPCCWDLWIAHYGSIPPIQLKNGEFFHPHRDPPMINPDSWGFFFLTT